MLITYIDIGIQPVTIFEWLQVGHRVKKDEYHEKRRDNRPTDAPVKRRFATSHVLKVPAEVLDAFNKT